MNLMVPQGPLDEAAREDGDPFFTGVNERLAPQQLPPGLGACGINKRFREGRAGDRDGIIILPWGLGLDGLTPFNNPLAAAVFRDPVNPAEWILVVDLDGLWKTQPNNTATTVPVPAGVTFTATSTARFVQCLGVLILLRGPDLAPLVCTDLDIGFRPLLQTSEGDGTQPIPNSSFGLYYSNRLFLINGRDNVSQSDAGDYTRYVDVRDTFKINEGEDDALVVIKPFGADSLIMGKQRRIWKVLGVSGDLSNAVGPLNVTQEYGVAGPDAMVEYDSALYWWTGRELAAARLTETEETQAQTIELSENLQQTFGRLNARYSDRVELATWRKKLFVFLPADEAWTLGPNLVAGSYSGGGTLLISGLTVGQKYVVEFGADDTGVTVPWAGGAIEYGAGLVFPAPDTFITLRGTPGAAVTTTLRAILHEGVKNVVAVYDFVTGQWCGADESAALQVRQTFKFGFHGREQLAYIGCDGLLRAYEAGFEDEQLTNGGTFGPELCSGSYNAGGNFNIGTLVVGRRYRWVKGANDLSIQDGFFLTHTASCVFVASSTGPILMGTPSAAITASLKEVLGTIGPLPVVSRFRTRGYACQDAEGKRYAGFKALLSTLDPSYTLTTLTNGVNNETGQRSAITRDRTKYFQQGTADYDPTNVGDDAEVRGREDYSVLLDESVLGPNLLVGAVYEGLITTDVAALVPGATYRWVKGENEAGLRDSDDGGATGAVYIDSCDFVALSTLAGLVCNVSVTFPPGLPVTGSLQLLTVGLEPGTGVALDRQQDATERVTVDERGDFLQVQFDNTQGRCEVRAVLVEALERDRPGGLSGQ